MSEKDTLRELSHEVRSPVTALQMLLDLAVEGADGSLSLDPELAGMLRSAIGELVAFADRVQGLGVGGR